MSIRNLLVVIPFALGIACSHSSKSHAAASGGSSPGAQASQSYGGTVVTTAGTSTGKDGGTGSASGGTESGSSSGGSQDTQGGPGMGGGQMGSGGSSETMGSDQGTASGSSGTMSGTAQHSDDMMVAGKLTKVSKKEVTVTAKDGTATKLKIGDQTVVMMNGKEAKPSALKQGQPVHASYQEQGDDHVAVKIEVGKHKAQGHHGTSGSSGHMQGSGSSGAPGSTAGPQGSQPGGSDTGG
jgi:hypothetical protein